jgi:predicted metal-dependent hydrolase
MIEMRIPKACPPHTLADIVARHVKFLVRTHEFSHSLIPGIVADSQPIYLFAEQYSIQLQLGTSGETIVDTPLKKVIVPAKQEKIQRKTLYLSLKAFLKKYVERKTAFYAELMGNLTYNKVRIKYAKSLWGSCSSTGNLSFNVRLIHYPPAVIDYVIVHELAHLVHRNHSKDFWNYVEQFYPTYKKARGVLRKNAYG